jgi:hypothetical protein
MCACTLLPGEIATIQNCSSLDMSHITDKKPMATDTYYAKSLL